MKFKKIIAAALSMALVFSSGSIVSADTYDNDNAIEILENKIDIIQENDVFAELMADKIDTVQENELSSELMEDAVSYEVTGGNIYFDSATGAITDCDSDVTSAVIPSEIDGIAVTSIGNNAFKGCKSLTSIEIPDTVTSIGDGVFSECTSLESIKLPDSVTSIGKNAFYYCSNLTNIEISNSVDSIGVWAFYGCKSLTSIEIPNSVTSIGIGAFIGCTSLASIKIPNTITTIENSTFSGCTSLTSIEIPNTVTSIGDGAFFRCTSLKSIELPNTVTTIGNGAFNVCGLTSIELPDSVINIGESAFSECIYLTSVKLPNSVTTIGSSAFNGCTSLISIELPNSVTSIGVNTFNGCTSLTSIKLPNSVTTIENNAFFGCTNLTSIEISDSLTTIGVFAFYRCTSLESIKLPDSVTTIGNKAFNECTSLTSIEISNSVTTIDDYTFNGCTSLKSVEIPDSVTTIGVGAFNGCTSLKSVEIPNTVTSIGVSAFIGCESLISIEIPNSVTSIGNSAFSGCTNLTSIKLPDTVTIIDNHTFNRCESLTSIELPNSITTIGEGAFNGCTSLESIKLPDTVTTIGNNAFFGCESLTSIELPNSVTTIGNSAFSGCTNLTSIKIPGTVTTIGNNAFSECTNLTSIKLPDTVTTIGNNAFSGCTSLKSIVISNTVTDIGDYVFSGCTSLESIKIPDSVTTIGNYAFNECTNLTSIELPNTVKSIGSSAFFGCESLTSIELPNTVEFIGGSVFEECTSLISIELPNTVEFIGGRAFEGCTSLTSIKLPNTITTIENGIFYRCTSLANIEIPNSVKSIGSGAFEGCTSLTSIKIPDLVTTIDESAFSGCTNLTSIELSNTVSTIGRSAFENCTNLRSIELPNTVTTIGGWAFSGCESLTSIKIPNSVTIIGGSSFSHCTSLTSIEIPNTITTIGESAFYKCESLTSIELPNSVTTIGQMAFESCTSLTSVKIPNSVITIGKGNVIGGGAFSYCTNLTSIEIPNSVTFIDKYTFSGCGNLTIYCYSGSYAEKYAIQYGIPYKIIENTTTKPENTESTTSKPEYTENTTSKPWGTSHTTIKPGFSNDIIYIKSVNTFVKLKDENSPTYKIKNIDLLSQPITLTKGKNDGTIFEVSLDYDWGNEIPGKIVVGQDTMHYIDHVKSEHGKFSFEPLDNFENGKKIYIMLFNSDNEIVYSRQLLLNIVEPIVSGSVDMNIFKDGEFSLFDALKFSIDDNKPVVGGMDFELDFGKFKIEIESDLKENTFKGSIGIEREMDLEENKWEKEEWNSFKDYVNEKKEDAKKGITAYDFSKGYKSKNKPHNIKITSGWTPSVEVVGYIEGNFINGKPVITNGCIAGTGAISYEFKGQTIVSVVPVCYEISGGGTVNVTLGVKNLQKGNGFKPSFTGQMELSIPEFEISGGVGVCDVASAGARGEADLKTTISFDNKHNIVQLNGSAYFEVKTLGFRLYDKEIASGTWTVYETGRTRLMSEESEKDFSYDDIDVNKVYRPEDRSYISDETKWVGDSNIEMFSGDYTNKGLKVLQTNSYADGNPQIMNVDGTKVIVWIADNADRDDYNKNMLVYSVYDSENDTWSEPAAIMDNGFADYYPKCKDGYVVWSKSVRSNGENTTLADIASALEIYVSKFNGTSFDTPVKLTDNDVVDVQAQIAVNGDDAAVVWVQNDVNNILGTSGTNSIYKSEYKNGVWGEAQLVKDNLNAIPGLNIGYLEDEEVIVYCLDEDNALDTIDDRELYIVKSGSVSKFTDNDVIDSKPVFSKLNGKNTLFWFSGDNIRYTDSLSDEIERSVFSDSFNTDEYSIVCNDANTAVIWTSVENGISEVHSSLYDGVQWSEDVQLTYAGESIRYPNGIVDNDGTIMFVFNRIQNIEDGSYFKDGRSDLCIATVIPSYNIELEYAELADDVNPNSEIPVYLVVKNNGELPVNGFKATIYDTDNTVCDTIDFEYTVLAGETVEAEGSYCTGENINPGNLKVEVSLKDGEEFDLTDNSMKIQIGQADVAVEDVIVSGAAVSGNYNVAVKVANNGFTNAENIPLSLKIDDENGDVISAKTIESLNAQSETTVTFEVNKTDIADDKDNIVLCAYTEYENDAKTGNNYKGFILSENIKKVTSPLLSKSEDKSGIVINGNGWDILENNDGCSAVSNQIGKNESTDLAIIVNDDCTVKFNWKIDTSDTQKDKGTFEVDGEIKADTASYDAGKFYESDVIEVKGKGTHILKWVFEKGTEDSENNGLTVSDIVITKNNTSSTETSTDTSTETSTDTSTENTTETTTDDPSVPSINVYEHDNTFNVYEGDSNSFVLYLNNVDYDKLSDLDIKVESSNSEVAWAKLGSVYDVLDIFVVSTKGISSGTAKINISIEELGLSQEVTLNVKDHFSEYPLGDANADKKITISDAVYILDKIKSGKTLPIEFKIKDYMKYVDINGDGKLTNEDAQLIIEKVRKMDYKLSAE